MMDNFPYEAVILDLDGVVTDTRSLHLKAWEETLQDYSFEVKDYWQHLDGRPREDGIRAFLNFKEIQFNERLVQILSEKKDQLYLSQLKSKGPNVFIDSLKVLKEWHEKGLPLAIVSSSKNCSEVLKAAGLSNFFDAQVDSLIAEKIQLRGKPEPDYFVEAANRLGKRPETCAIVEDSLVGVEAGVKGHFKGIIGISREGQTPASELYAHGADIVVDDLNQIGKKQNAIKAWRSITQKIGDREIALFLDFDGTLSDITQRPLEAKIRDLLVPILTCCAQSLKMAIVSGRDRQDVKGRVGVENCFYAGCHGFDISGPGGFHYEVEQARALMPEILSARGPISSLLKDFPGAEMEEKKFFTAIHYRNVEEERMEILKDKVLAVIGNFPHLEIRHGKMVMEISPKLPWGKGKAIKKLCEVLEIERESTLPVYIGDDVTDEDAFKEISGKGIGIKVGVEDIENSKAQYWLEDPAEVDELLSLICRDYTAREKKWRHGN